MRIINGKRYLQSQIDGCRNLGRDGWDTREQWYYLYYNPDCDLVRLRVRDRTSGMCEREYFFDSPKAFRRWCNETDQDLETLLGDCDENDAVLMQFVDELYPPLQTA